MRRELLVAAGIGLVVMLVVLGGVLLKNRGARIRLDGKIQKVRVQGIETSTVLIVDFRINNPSEYPFVIRDASVLIEGQDGKKYETVVASDSSAASFLKAYPLLGEKYNDSLIPRDKIAAGQGRDAMIAVRIEMPETQVQSRKNLILRIEDVDGAVTDIREK